MICKYCKNFSVRSIRDKDYTYQPSFQALKESADQGCGLCVHLVEALAVVKDTPMAGEKEGIFLRRTLPWEDGDNIAVVPGSAECTGMIH